MQTLSLVEKGEAKVFTDPSASPTGFPFKIVQLAGTLSDEFVSDTRPRLCQLGFLRSLYKREDGTVGYRCPGEPVGDYLRKGGKQADTEGRKCLCNGLMANIGLAQEQLSGYVEKSLVTAGDSLGRLKHFLKDGVLCYSADEVIDYLLSGSPAVVVN